MALTHEEIAAIPDEQITSELARELFPPVAIGPTWQVNEDGTWHLPEYTLGWGILAWCHVWLMHPTEDGPWRFTPEQARFVLWWYETDKHGRRIHSKGVLQRIKGWGKDPFAAAIGMAELLGPVLFDRVDPKVRGGMVGKPRRTALVQVVGVTREQGVTNTMHFVPEIIPPKTVQEYNLDIQKEVIQVKGRPGHRFEAMTSSERSAEGNRPTFVILNEIHHWIPSRGGEKLMRTIRNNVRKTKGSWLAITNAYVPGEESELEKIRWSVDQFKLGLGRDPKILYDSLEAHPDAPFTPEWGIHIIKMCAGDSHPWVSWEEAATEDFGDASISEAQQRRMWYNRIVEAEDAVFSESEWDGIHVHTAIPDKSELKLGDTIVLGFDGGRKDDATALVAIRLRDRMIVPLAVWQSPPRTRERRTQQWEMDPQQASAAVHLAFHSYNVVAFFADVEGYDSWIFQWELAYGPRLQAKATSKRPIAFDMRGHQEEIVRGHEDFMQEVIDRRIWHNGDPILRKHALNARRNAENRYGVSFRKDSRESPNKIDTYAATICAYLALRAFQRDDKPQQFVDRSVHFG